MIIGTPVTYWMHKSIQLIEQMRIFDFRVNYRNFDSLNYSIIPIALSNTIKVRKRNTQVFICIIFFCSP